MGVEDNEKPGHCRICIRGDVHNQGPVVPRGFLSVATSGPTAGFPENESGRRQLAQWIASPQNPLTARVICNRIWHHLFGEGIVRTVDNFGHVGERPSHPELLDWLAVRFVNDGWSTKSMIRRIVVSRAYQLTSERDGGDSADPENRWLARMNRRRLEAETIRDAVLFVSGQLDLEGGGPTIRKGTKSEFDYHFNSRMRSVYVAVFRNALHELFEVFDFPDPNLVIGRRNTSTLPTQALYLMNSPFVRTQSRFAARRLSGAGEADHAGGIDAAYRQVLGRPPTNEERRLAAAFLHDFTSADDGQQSEHNSTERRLQAWTALYQSLFSCIDFRYLH